ncbi:MAG: hypothetical protein WKF33_03635 [Thermoleophilaceae bacterium]
MNGPRAKVERANEHISDLVSEIERFHHRNPYEVVREIEADTGDLLYSFRVRVALSPRLALIAGDAVHNLRSALDLLYRRLVEVNGKPPSESDAFPIFKSRTKAESGLGQVEGRIGRAAGRAVGGLKPYPGGNDGLWRLRELDVIDKHRLLLAIWASSRSVVFHHKMPVPWQDEPVILPPIAIGEVSRDCLEEGSPLTRISPESLASDMHKDPEFRIEIALDEPPVVQCEPLIPTLNDLAGLVSEIVELFAPHIEEH